MALAFVWAVSSLSALCGQVSKEVRQLHRKLSQPGIFLEQQHDIIAFPLSRFISPETVDFVEERRQGGEEFFVPLRCFDCLHAAIIIQRPNMIGLTELIAANLCVTRRMLDTHDKFLIAKWPGCDLRGQLSIESRANLRRKRNGQEARQMAHESLESHDSSD
jgi:hypothetical protein